MTPIRYSIVARHAAAHLFDVTLTLDDPDPEGQAFFLPAWIPGSYMIREFARNIVTLTASDAAGRAVSIQKTDKHRWRAEPVDGTLTLHYQVYAWDLSVRSAHLDDTVGFFNGTSVFLAVQGREHAPCVVDILRPEGEAFAEWRVATSLPTQPGTERHCFGTYEAENYDALIDHPVTLGHFVLASFDAFGVPHDVVISGPVPNLDMARLTADLTRICETQIALFEPDSRKAPVSRYVFMTMAVTDGYGGLEHRASTALIAKRSDFPIIGDPTMSDGYRTYLGLCSHEYFHTWNVKRIKPAVFAPYDLERESYTTLLWLFEGFTSYYDDLILARSGAISHTDYLRLLGKTIGGVLRGSGRRKQTVAESSFDAWVKYYRQDENASNAIVSYYTKGSLVALAFDLTIRARTAGMRSLDDVMRTLWQRYGRAFFEGKPVGIAEDAVLSLMCEATGADLADIFALAVNSTEDLPLESLLKEVGVTLAPVTGKVPVSIGARVRTGAETALAAVFDDGAAQRAGLSAGDVLVAIDGLRVNGSNLDSLLARFKPGTQVELHAFRRDVLRCFAVTLDGPDVTEYALSIADAKANRGSERHSRLDAWLGGAAAAASSSR